MMEHKEILIDNIEVKERIRKDLGNIEELKDSINELGLLEPIVVNASNRLLAGYRRYTACKQLGWKKIPASVATGLNELKEFDIELHENLKRKQFTPMEEAEALMERKAIYERVYPETKQASSEQMKAVRRGVKITARQDSFTESTAKVMDISRSAVEKKLALNALPDKYKEELRQPRAKVSVIMKKMKIEKQKEDIKKIEPAKGIYDVIVMDPPWDFTSGDRNMPDYPRMTQSELEKIKLPASKDCILWLWTIDIKLKEAIELLESWGFERKSTLIWVKQHWGVGNWLRNQHEYCFIAIKGKPLFTGEKESTVLHADKTGHSTKPDEFYKLVERTCYGRKLDYFARKKREGWDVYGDEVA